MGDHDLSKDMMLFGAIGEPKYRKVFHAGSLTAVFEDGMLRTISIGETEIVRGVYVAVRDHDWNTIAPRFLNESFVQFDESFLLKFTAEHKNGEIDFVWNAVIAGNADGTIRFSMNGVVNKEFRKNRIGFCVLHQMELSGENVFIASENALVKGVFPKYISPHQPFTNITGMQYQVDAHEVKLNFIGDVFEMEDQRNWTDASFKTYCTPLSLPYPTKLEKGTKVSQVVEVTVKANQSHIVDPPLKSNTLNVTSKKIGHIPGIGLVDGADAFLSADEMLLLQRLTLDHLRGVIDLTTDDWREKLNTILSNARSLSTNLDLEVILENVVVLTDFANEVMRINAPIMRIFFFDKKTSVTTKRILDAVRKLDFLFSDSIQIGGGSRAFFAEFNRAQLPLDQIDVVTYTINPQVHAFDNYSLLETLKAQPVTVQTAKRIANEKPVVVGPITFKMRFNPNADDVASENANDLNFDPRQKSLFGACWTLGSIKYLSMSEATALTYYNTTGLAGLMNAGLTFPLYQVLADVTEFSGGEVLEVETSDGVQVEAFAMIKDSRIRLLLENTSNQDQHCKIEWPFPGVSTIRFLDETNVNQAISQPISYRDQVIEIIGCSNHSVVIKQYGVVCIDYFTK